MRDRVKLTLTGVEGQNGNNLSGGSWNKVRFMNYNHEMSLMGVEPPYFAVLVDYHADATLKSGRVIHSEFNDIGSLLGRGRIVAGIGRVHDGICAQRLR